MTTRNSNNTHDTNSVPKLKSATDIEHNPSEVAELIDSMFDTCCADPSGRIGKVRQSLMASHNLRITDSLMEACSDAEDIHSMAQLLINGRPFDE